MSLDPEREPITRPVFVWLEVAAQLVDHGEGGLATAIQEEDESLNVTVFLVPEVMAANQ